MPEPLTAEYLRETQRVIAAVPPGPWEVEASEHGAPDSVGPISYLETWSGQDQLPVIEFVGHAREALPRYVGEVSRQRTEIEFLRRRLARLEGGARDGS
ncbi:hypothetical protein ABZ468_25650 [Streptomyces sp. NPDC005708]|uniref:hypothetical protein n=1 Tax=Streptomyces sp. NPDC005708 TaxID=3154564 RepID=UPI0033E2F07A